MSKTKFTLGPWEARRLLRGFSVASPLGRVAHTTIKPSSGRAEQGWADACLIAAAPEMYAAASALLEELDANGDDATQLVASSTREWLVSALKKARGEQGHPPIVNG